MNKKIIGADVPLYGYENLLKKAINLAKRNDAVLYLAGKRDKQQNFSVTNYCEENIAANVHFFPYYDTCRDFPVLKKECFCWIDKNTDPDFLTLPWLSSNQERIALFATMFHPLKHEGNSFAMRFWLDKLRKRGYKIHLLYYMLDSRDVKACMHDRCLLEYDKYIQVPVESCSVNVNRNGLNVHVDDWCGFEAIEAVKELTASFAYDICFTNYAFFTSIFEYCHAYTQKILFTHDSFADRNKRMLAQGYKWASWVSLTEAGESLACSRSDVVIAIQEAEAELLRQLTPPEVPVCVVSPLSAKTHVDFPVYDGIVYIGYMGSHNCVNDNNLAEFAALISEQYDILPYVHILIAGPVSLHIEHFWPTSAITSVPHTVLGPVDDLKELFQRCTIVINPERGGTGIKIKCLDSFSHGAALVCTVGAVSGIRSECRFHNAPDIPSMIPLIREVVENPDIVPILREESVKLFDMLLQQQEGKVSMVLDSQPQAVKSTPYIDQHASGYHFHHMEQLLSRISVEGKTVVEIGSDQYLVTARLLISNGATKVYTYNYSGDWVVREDVPEEIEFIVGDFADAALDPGSVDLVYSIAVLEHIIDYDKVLTKITECLKPSGRFYMQGEPLWAGPRGHHLWYHPEGESIPFTFHGRNPIPDWSHLVHSPEELEQLLIAAGECTKHAHGIVKSVFQDPSGAASNFLLSSAILAWFDKYTYFEAQHSLASNSVNEYFEEASRLFNEDELHCSGLTIFGRAKQQYADGSIIPGMVSIVIPCYNVLEYVEECVCSVLAQSYDNLEIILVDDASSDGTQDVLNRITLSDERVVLHRHKHNLGLGPARNTGVTLAHGQYLFFLDSDDYLATSDVLETLVNTILEQSVPVVIAMCKKLLLSGNTEDYDAVNYSSNPNAFYAGKDAAFGALRTPGYPPLPVRAWGTIIDTVFYRSMSIAPFPPGAHEDLAFVPFLYAMASRVFYSSCMAVVYRERAGSLSSQRWNSSDCATHCQAWPVIQDNAKLCGLEEYIPALAYQHLNSHLWKVFVNGIESSATDDLLSFVEYIARSIKQQPTEQYNFATIFSYIRALQKYDLSGETYRQILGSFHPDNVLQYFLDSNAVTRIPALPIVECLEDANPMLVPVMEAYHSRCPDTVKIFPAMLTEGDRAIYFYAASQVQFQGEVIDAGCFVGGTTYALIEGLRQNAVYARHSDTKIRVFDLFKIDVDYIQDWVQKIYGDEYRQGMTSFRPFFDKNMVQFQHMLDVYEGDIIATGYPQKKPIELLALDCCKNIAVTDSVLRSFFPYLIPGASHVIHQDYIHAWHPYIHISMELLSDYFEPALEINYGGSYMWKCIKRITPDTINSIFGPAPVTSLSESSWFSDQVRNDILLQKKQVSMLYAQNRMELGMVRALYFSYLGMDDEAALIAKNCRAQYQKCYLDPNIAKKFNIE